MTWWQEHLILNVAVMLYCIGYTEGEVREGLWLYLLFFLVYYGFMGLFCILIINGGHIGI